MIAVPITRPHTVHVRSGYWGQTGEQTQLQICD